MCDAEALAISGNSGSVILGFGACPRLFVQNLLALGIMFVCALGCQHSKLTVVLVFSIVKIYDANLLKIAAT